MARTTRAAKTIAVALGAAGLLAGCGATSDCQKLTPQISNVPACSNVVAPGATVSYQIDICPTCTQSDPSCVAVYDYLATDQTIQLEPFVAMCEPDNSCPPNPTCNVIPCSFRAPSTPGSYTLTVIDQNGTPNNVPFVVQAGGGTSCI